MFDCKSLGKRIVFCGKVVFDENTGVWVGLGVWTICLPSSLAGLKTILKGRPSKSIHIVLMKDLQYFVHAFFASLSRFHSFDEITRSRSLFFLFPGQDVLDSPEFFVKNNITCGPSHFFPGSTGP